MGNEIVERKNLENGRVVRHGVKADLEKETETEIAVHSFWDMCEWERNQFDFSQQSHVVGQNNDLNQNSFLDDWDRRLGVGCRRSRRRFLFSFTPIITIVRCGRMGVTFALMTSGRTESFDRRVEIVYLRLKLASG
ncbi:hypothetical protein CEXT_754601 [Caerostris extrusa]|uniref:Uncharacterized protein n=1 Tax=Caerostris extrusa TaxID=172846 RepID=A0AAV4NUW2_CAEEX|nr:hypothetical protein CEXT_754601 [Caerostris extrusa]